MKKIALLGFGTIGSAVGNIILNDGQRRREQFDENPNSVSAIADKMVELEIVSVAALGEVNLPNQLKDKLTADAFAAIRGENGEKPDIVVELIGGIHPAKEFIEAAINEGCNVVTANKAVLGEHGFELRTLAQKKGVKLLYEAAVGGAVPIVRAIRHSLMGDKIVSIRGVLNGTTNFILDKMTREGVEYSDALKEAQALGFAEADPTADVEGYDPAAKIAILASLAFGRSFTVNDVKREGITKITQGMIIAAKNNGQVFKLVASAVREGCQSGDDPKDNITLKVEPLLVPEKSAFGELEGSMNAVEVISEYCGTLTFSGHGAGGDPTASAVLADIIEAAS